MGDLFTRGRLELWEGNKYAGELASEASCRMWLGDRRAVAKLHEKAQFPSSSRNQSIRKDTENLPDFCTGKVCLIRSRSPSSKPSLH
jgi:hypothetical protein